MKKNIASIFLNILIFICAILMIMPIIIMIISSLKCESNVFKMPFEWIPKPINLNNYIVIFEKYQLITNFKNSIFITVINTSLNLFISSLAGYSLAKFKYKGKKIILAFIIVTLLLPTQIIAIPLYMVISSMKLVDSLWAIILPYITSPFAVFFMRQYFLSIPDELIEAARVEGASELTIFFKIILPLAKPALIALGTFSFTFNWNNYLWPMLALRTQSKYTIPLGISMMKGEYSTPYNELFAAATIASLPVLLVYFILQKRFIGGFMMPGLIRKDDRYEETN